MPSPSGGASPDRSGSIVRQVHLAYKRIINLDVLVARSLLVLPALMHHDLLHELPQEGGGQLLEAGVLPHDRHELVYVPSRLLGLPQFPEDTEDPEQEDSVGQPGSEIEAAPVDGTQDNEQTPEQVPEVPEQDEPQDEQVPEAVEEPSTSQDITSQEPVEVSEDTKGETVVEEAPASQNVDNQSESDIEHNNIVEETVEQQEH